MAQKGNSLFFATQFQEFSENICTDIEHSDTIDRKVVKLAEGAKRAYVKMLAITYHDPDQNDEFLELQEKECQKRFEDCVLARVKTEIDL